MKIIEAICAASAGEPTTTCRWWPGCRPGPGLHVYHYNHYEPTSVDHLTELHGTRQARSLDM